MCNVYAYNICIHIFFYYQNNERIGIKVFSIQISLYKITKLVTYLFKDNCEYIILCLCTTYVNLNIILTHMWVFTVIELLSKKKKNTVYRYVVLN